LENVGHPADPAVAVRVALHSTAEEVEGDRIRSTKGALRNSVAEEGTRWAGGWPESLRADPLQFPNSILQAGGNNSDLVRF
jgi:hypothetical protein